MSARYSVTSVRVLLGDDTRGLSAATITRLLAEWDGEYEAFRWRDLSDRDYVCVLVEVVHFNIRLEDDRCVRRWYEVQGGLVPFLWTKIGDFVVIAHGSARQAKAAGQSYQEIADQLGGQ